METVEMEPTLREIFVVDSEEKANWVLCLMANLDAEAARIKAQTDKRLKQIANEKQGLYYRYEADLRAFAALELARQKGKRKSVVLMQGTLAFQSVGESFSVADEAAALDWVRRNSHTDAIRTVETLDKEAYKKLQKEELDSTGALLPGIERQEAREVFSIRVVKPNEPDTGD